MILKVENEGVYTLAEPDAGLELRADHLRRDHRTGEISGELQVTCSEHAAQTGAPLSVGSFNFSSPQARSTRVKLVKDRGGKALSKVNVFECLERFCQYIAQQERSGEPAVVLRDVISRRPEDTSFEVLGVKLPLKHLAILFGAPGTMKSYLALLVAVTQAQRGQRVLYIDWELDAADHRYRLECIAGNNLPDGLFYCRCRKPLVQEIDRLRRIGKAQQIDYYILDSVGYGTAGDPAAADAALDFCRAAGQLPGGQLALAHITKNGETNDQMPYGSMFWHASARSTWNIKTPSESPDGSVVKLALFNRKSNLGRKQSPLGLSVAFDTDRVEFQRTDVGSIDGMADSLPLWRRMVSLLKTGPQTVATLASETGKTPDTVDRTARRYKELFAKVTGDDHITRVALIEKRAA